MQFALLVNAAADSPAALTALNTAKALHAHPQHQLYRLFFYADGIHLCHRHAWRGDGDNANAAQQWQQWIQATGVSAEVCVGAAQRRGIVSGDQGKTLAEGFSLAGLGQWADAMINAERVIQFG
ncbi:sulfurtransferase complex subunit TusD [Alcanivorax sp. S6407]|uniref:sulfurtransferase complex subunit TusD n=1 Tax=Alcanivorax sp. S6407 TaxID=2926424 RepID=UPI001FF23727|nr:sulfurtransferase complex subunit TusD [Alcanivorax sp. S6407]MCK0152415.1 sulfurtransferase complex subunit TusD [Alcanivorax sp. S6407]